MDTDRNSPLLPNPRRDEPKHEPPNGNAEPESRVRHAASEGLPPANLDHELDDPAAEGDLEADVAQQQECAHPGHTSGWFLQERFLDGASGRV